MTHCDIFFHKLTHALFNSSYITNTSLSLLSTHPAQSLCTFSFPVKSVLPGYSGKDTLHWKAAKCQEFLQHFHWLRELRGTALPACLLAWRHTLTILQVWLIHVWLWLLIGANWLMPFDFRSAFLFKHVISSHVFVCVISFDHTRLSVV